MKKSLLIVLVCSVFMACHSDIDLNNVDTTAELEFGAALPIGSVRAKLGDFAGKIDHVFIDSANGGVITWRDTFPDSRHYTDYDITQHVSGRVLKLNVYEKAQAAHLIGPNGKVTGTGQPVTLKFRLPIILNDLNKPGITNRLDSALIKEANFMSVIDTVDLPLKWEWIDAVELVLGEQVCREKGDTMTVYRRGEGGNYGQQIQTTVDAFSICLMKDRNLNFEKNNYEDYHANAIDSCVFGVNFIFTIPKGVEVPVPETARFQYSMDVQFIDYTAIWGFFEPSKDMSANEVIDLADSWGSISFLKRASTPFSDPKVDAQVETKLAGELLMEGKHLYVINNQGDSIYALFNGSRHRKAESMSPYLSPDPKVDPIGKSVRTSVLFDKDPQRGEIDRLFRNMPQKMGYCFDVYFNREKTPQIRFTPDNRVSVDAVCTLPMKFADGLFVDYRDTLQDVDISKLSIDSLVSSSEYIDSIQTSDINLYMTAISEIPLTIKATMIYLDSLDRPIKDPEDQAKLFNPFAEDTIRINPPRFEKNAMGGWAPVENGRSIITAKLTKEKLDLMPDVKSIIYHVFIDNASLNEAYQQGLHEVPLHAEQRLELKIGLTAKVDAVMNFNK